MWKYNSDFFQTDTGVPQGDCASVNEFTFYLAKALLSDNQAYEHDYAKNICVLCSFVRCGSSNQIEK